LIRGRSTDQNGPNRSSTGGAGYFEKTVFIVTKHHAVLKAWAEIRKVRDRPPILITRERNTFVARIADKLCFIYAELGGSLQALAAEMTALGKIFVPCR
jgi:hypothetical protein